MENKKQTKVYFFCNYPKKNIIQGYTKRIPINIRKKKYYYLM